MPLKDPAHGRTIEQPGVEVVGGTPRGSRQKPGIDVVGTDLERAHVQPAPPERGDQPDGDGRLTGAGVRGRQDETRRRGRGAGSQPDLGRAKTGMRTLTTTAVT